MDMKILTILDEEFLDPFMENEGTEIGKAVGPDDIFYLKTKWIFGSGSVNCIRRRILKLDLIS